jgi:hypothetical protein
MKYEENEQDKYLTLTEVSKLLSIHPNTLRNWDATDTQWNWTHTTWM